jgi:D-glycero-D-manno-heptose 1,7-bisphosphate phosphatase
VPDRVALLDRDGTIIVERNYLSDPNGVELLPGAASGLRKLRDEGYRLVLVTNQSGIGRGFFTAETVDRIHSALQQQLAVVGVSLDGIYICPHTPEDCCDCRKPEPGLVWKAASELNFDPRNAVVIGDKRCDVELAQSVGAVSVLVKTGYGAKHLRAVHADVVADDLEDAARRLQTLEPK